MKRGLWIALFLLSVTHFTPSAQATAVGEKAPIFELSGTDGKSAVVNGVGGSVTVVNFWASWCGPCAIEFPSLNRLAADYKGKNVNIVATSVDTNRGAADHFLTNQAKTGGLALTVLFDPESKALDSYGARAMPTSYIVDRRGVVRFIHVGFREDDPERWRKEIDQLLSETK